MTSTIEPLDAPLSHAPARACMPWCRDHDGHEAEFSAADQTCWSVDRVVPVTTPDPSSPPSPTRRGVLPCSTVYLEGQVGEPTTVCIGFGERIAIKYTPAEARRLAMEIIEQAAVAER